jgi:hypothetical protein
LFLVGDATGFDRLGVGLHLLAHITHRTMDHPVVSPSSALTLKALAIAGHADLQLFEGSAVGGFLVAASIP